MARRFTPAQLRALMETSRGEVWVWFGAKRLGLARNHWVVGDSDMAPAAYDWLHNKGYISMAPMKEDERILAYVTAKGREELPHQLDLEAYYQAQKEKNRDKTRAASEAYRPRRTP